MLSSPRRLVATVLSAPRPKPRSVRHFWPLATRFPSFISLVCPPPSLSFLCPTMGFPESSAGKESTCNVGDLGSIPGLGRCPGEGKGYPFQYSDLENSMDCTVHGVTKSWTRLSDFHFHFSARNITGSCQPTDATPAPSHPFQ